MQREINNFCLKKVIYRRMLQFVNARSSDRIWGIVFEREGMQEIIAASILTKEQVSLRIGGSQSQCLFLILQFHQRATQQYIHDTHSFINSFILIYSINTIKHLLSARHAECMYVQVWYVFREMEEEMNVRREG